MPITIKYYPEDFSREHGSLGVKLPMNSRGEENRGMFNVSYTTEDQAVSNYINLLMTKKGERYMQPEYGIGLPYRLFEPNNDILQATIEFEIKAQAAIWLPYISNKRITVSTATQIPGLGANTEHGIHIVIEFSVTDFGANRAITVFNTSGIINIEVS